MATSFDRLKELNLSRDEVNRIGEALKKQEFRKLLADYVEEIQDPQNRQIYEEEVKQIERERGQEVTFLHPTAGYVIKTSINGNEKCFINICSNENINKPSSTPTTKDGARGLQWSLPHSLSPSHEDIDNKGIRCQVYDVLFNPDTLHLANKNGDFHSMVNNVALTALEDNFNVALDKKNLKFPKMSYKGLKRPTLMRKTMDSKPIEKIGEEKEFFDKIYAEIDSHRSVKSPRKAKTQKNKDNSVHTAPKYVIKHRSHIDIQDFTEHKNAKMNVTIPKELIVEINLPLLKSSSDMDLDVTEKTIQLVSEKPAKYKLNLTLPYYVNEGSGTAKFDKDLKKLVITLPVKRKNCFEMRDDSGVDSCFESDLNSPSSPESDEEDDHFPQDFPTIENTKLVEEVNNKSCDIKMENSDDFLNANDLYNLPEFTCNVFGNIVAFTFNVKYVDENTVCKKYCPNSSLLKIKFTSVSSSFYPTCYAFYVKFPKHQLKDQEVNIETWDNNVILQIPLETSSETLVSYLYGINLDNLVEKCIEQPSIINKFLKEPSEPQCNEKNLEDQKADMLCSSDDFSEKEINEIVEKNQNTKLEQKVVKSNLFALKSKAIDIFATSYESSGDELSLSSFSPSKSKGILKRRSRPRTLFGRSISESSLDDFFCSSFENYHGSIECVPEDSREDGLSSSLKKTVRFNDIVTKQLFRSNSSILGQKKKNQRKARNKKRAHERRFSESEASDVESKKEGDEPTVSNNAENQNMVLNETAMNKKDDSDIFHLEMNN